MGAYLSEPITTKESTDGGNERVKYGSSAMQGWRTGMEDAHTTFPDLDRPSQLSFFGVFDGHGGKEVALFCQKNLHLSFQSTPEYARGDIGQALKRAFLEMDEKIQTKDGRSELAGYMQHSDNEDDNEPDEYLERNAGCTSVVAVIKGTTLTVANAGDSRCVLCRGGVAVDMSLDHKPGHDIETQRILKAGGFINDGRVNGSLALSRAIGDLEFKRSHDLTAEEQIVTANPDIKVVELQPTDEFMILACDGIWDVLESQKCIDFIRERMRAGEPLRSICESLCDRCMAQDTRGSGIGCDNMSVVIVQFEPALTGAKA